MAIALSWEKANGLPPEVARILGTDAELLLAIPEHKVALPGGRRDSQCDVFALARNLGRTIALAIEGKVNEPFGPTVGEWLVDGSEGRVVRLNSICQMLGSPYPPPENLRYQLFHRTAAAIIEAKRFKTDEAAMIVHSFSQSHQWFDDFSAFCEYLGQVAVLNQPIEFMLGEGMKLTLGWATGSVEHT